MGLPPRAGSGPHSAYRHRGRYACDGIAADHQWAPACDMAGPPELRDPVPVRGHAGDLARHRRHRRPRLLLLHSLDLTAAVRAGSNRAMV